MLLGAGQDVGDRVASLDEATIALTAAERDLAQRELAAAARLAGTRSLDDEELLTAAELGASLLPARVRAALTRFRRFGNPSGALLLRNLPGDDVVPPTPANGYL